MVITRKEWLDAADALIGLLEFAVKFTPTEVDDKAIADVKSWRERIRPILGATGDHVVPGDVREEVHLPNTVGASAAIEPATINATAKFLVDVAPHFIEE